MLADLPKKYQQIFADVPPKENKKIQVTTDEERFYRTLDNVFFVPPLAYLQDNLKELNTLQETFDSYYKADNIVHESWNLDNVAKAHYSSTKGIIQLIKVLMAQEEIAVDIETTGFGLFGDEIILIVFSWGDDFVATINRFTNTIIRYLQVLFAQKDIKFIWQNGKFDIVRLKTLLNIDARVDEDTMLMHYIGFNENRGTHGLGYLAMLYLGAPNWEKDLDNIKRRVCREKKIKQADFHYGMFPEEDLIEYACYDGLATIRLYKYFKKMFPEERTFIYRKLIEAANSLAHVERVGVYADQEMISKLDEELTAEYHELIDDIEKMTKNIWDPEKYMGESGAKSAGDNFNPNSPQQLKWLLSAIGFNVPDTAEDTLKGLDHEVVRKILKMRRNNKYRRTYVHGLRSNIDLDGRIHTTYNLHGTVTGRLSSSNPNLQNIPRDKTIKNIFKATPGHILVQADYSQAELRVLAVLSGDPWLQNVYKEGKDLHSEVAIEYWGEDFTEEDRVKAKAVNFGIAYGRTEQTLAPSLGISLEEARKLLQDWYEPMPYVRKYFDDKIRTAFEQKKSVTPFNRYRSFIVTSGNKFAIRNEAMNTAIQGTASDLTLFSLIEIEKELREKELGNIVLTVHDSIIVETIPENRQAVSEIMVRHMEAVPKKYLKTDVPFAADIDVGELWGELD